MPPRGWTDRGRWRPPFWKDLTDLRLDGSEGSDGSAKSLLFMSRLDLLLYMYH